MRSFGLNPSLFRDLGFPIERAVLMFLVVWTFVSLMSEVLNSRGFDLDVESLAGFLREKGRLFFVAFWFPIHWILLALMSFFWLEPEALRGPLQFVLLRPETGQGILGCETVGDWLVFSFLTRLLSFLNIRPSFFGLLAFEALRLEMLRLVFCTFLMFRFPLD